MLDRGRTFAAALLAVLWMAPARADFVVGSGSSVDFADASIDFGCSGLDVAGQASGNAAQLGSIANFSLSGGGSFAAGASRLTIGGNFANAGSFAPGTSRVEFVDACGGGASQLTGATSFYDFSAVTASAKQLVLPVGAPQSVAHTLTLQGAAGNLLRVLSAAAGQRGIFAVAGGAAQAIAYVDARDNEASLATIAPGPAASYNSIDGGNLLNWFENPGGGGTPGEPVPTPALDAVARALLILLLLGAAAPALMRRLARARRVV